MDKPICVRCGVQRDEVEPNLWGIGTEPTVAIGQRSLVVVTENGNLLWDPVSYLDAETIARVRALGGIQAISASHPHFSGVVVEWSRAFGGASIHLPAADQEWLQRADDAYRFYADEVQPPPDLTLIRCGRHFDGSAVLHWPHGAAARGVLVSGDTIQVVMDRRAVSFMRSYPNLIPLDAESIRHLQRRLAPCLRPHLRRLVGPQSRLECRSRRGGLPRSLHPVPRDLRLMRLLSTFATPSEAFV